MTLTEFLQYPFTSDFAILNHITNTDSITIDYISILEPPAEEFVRSNELILSAAFSIKDDLEALYQFIYSVYESGASAIVFSFPNNSFSQLEPLLDTFGKLNFPILSMDYHHLFQDVVESTLREIWKKDSMIQTNLESIQRSLLSYYIHGNTLDDAAELISATLKSDVIILDMNHHILGRNEKIRSLSSKGILESRKSEILRIEISSRGHTDGYIILDDTASTSYLTAPTYSGYLISPLTLWFDKEYALISAQMKEKEVFVWKLAHHEFSSSEDLYATAELLSFNTSVMYACIIADISRNDVSDTIVQDQVIQTAKDFHLSVMTSLHHQRLLIYLETNEGFLSQELADTFITNCEQNIQNIIPTLHFLWGYDLQGFRLDALYNNYTNAKTALSICTTSGGKMKRCSFQLSLLDKMKSLLRENQEVTVLAEHTLSRLIEYDKEKNTEYLDTLREYIFHNYNATETAKAMNIHRQTMLYRLDKIEQISNLSLSNHESLFLIELCIRILFQ